MHLALIIIPALIAAAELPDATPALDAYSIGRHQGKMMLQALTGMTIGQLANADVVDLNNDGRVDNKDYLLYFTEKIRSSTGAAISLGLPQGYENPWLRIPAGRFRMGAVDGSSVAPGNEKPAHWVEVGAFEITQYEITNAEYRQFVLDGGYLDPQYWSDEGWDWVQKNRNTELEYWYGREYGQDLWPMVGVTWYEAEACCRWMGGRLPTEAEWEKAARWDEATKQSRLFPWGDAWEKTFCNGTFDENKGTARVGSYEKGRSFYGLDDACGNVWEWTADCFDPNAYTKRAGADVVNPKADAASCRGRVLKGGAWFVTGIGPRSFHCSFRHSKPPEYSGTDAGFRVARDVKE